MSKLSGESLNITEQNLAKLQQLFPEAFTEGKIDFDVLKQLLGDFVDDDEERYRFKWNGKGKALRLSQTTSMGTLRPCKEESKDWDTTQNLYIEGDNLEVLKLLQKSYYGKVKMIYIDPPYNTGKDFVYKDDFRDNIENYKRVTGQVDDEGRPVSLNTESNGRFHTDWLNMMYPRLRLARNLLSEDGVIFISIDDNEYDNLMKICDEIFGSYNRIGPIIQNKLNSKNDSLNTQKNHEFIAVYRKGEKTEKDRVIPSIVDKQVRYKEVFRDGEDYYFINDAITTRGEGGTLNARPNLGYTIYYNPVTKEKLAVADYDIELAKTSNIANEIYTDDYNLVEKGYNIIRPPKVRGKLGCWTWDLNKFNNQKHEIIVTGRAGSYSVKKRTFINKSDVEIIDGKMQYASKNESNIKSILEFSTNEGTKTLNDIFENGAIFNNPKNLQMIKYFCEIVDDKNSIILDFFSGSATTAHAVMQLNAEDGGHRKFIMVQLPEPCPKDKEAYKAGYKTIAEIGRERIRRAGEKILAGISQKSQSNEGLLIERERERELAHSVRGLDVGFKVFKLDSSNLRKWNPQPEDLQIALQESVENFLPDRKELDVVYEILLKKGYEITVPIAERDAAGKQVYIIGDGSLMVCLEDNITVAVADEIVKLHREYGTKDWSVVFQDNGFASDMDKTNIKETLKTAGLDGSCFECL